ncbi:nicotinate-nucleotide adenylyltransferase [soil metagenome]
MRIGVLGGTFDPPHIGHLAIVDAAIRELDLDEVILMPANRNPIKGRKVTTSPADRLGLAEALLRASDNPKLAVSDQEITRGGQSYAVDTMTELQMARPAEYWFLMGADSLKTISEWKQPNRLLKLCRLGVVVRAPNSPEEAMRRAPVEFRDKIDAIEMTPVDVSSTTLRDRLSRRLTVHDWIPIEVQRYISSHRLYQE